MSANFVTPSVMSKKDLHLLSSCQPGGLQPYTGQASWYVAYTQPKSEKIAVDHLDRQGFQTYCPQYKAFKKTPAGSLCLMEVMFPRYVFFKPRDERLSISVARSTRGVSFVLSFGARPA
ncbi:MAG: hypothetical protein H7224_10405, partial [Polaromonas sp.]|nr:hypothetical protein [Polaromonas sp.]